jgi:hypothetical protein
LRDSVAAHRDIEARSFAGSALLLAEAIAHDATM